jgi:hypothetical protein
MLRSIAFALALACTAIVAFSCSLFLADMAFGSTISGTSQTFDSNIRQRLSSYEDWAVWNGGTLQANVTSGAGWINYSLVATPYVSPATPVSLDPGVAIFNTGNGYYLGGLSYVTSSAEGKGFTLTVPYQYANNRRLDLWFMTNGPVSADVTASAFDGATSTVHLNPYQNYIVSFEATGLTEDLTVNMVGRGNFTSAQGQMSFGAAALTPVLAVPEPDYWLALLLLLGGVLAYATVGVVIWVREVLWALDEEQRDFEAKKRD